MTAEVGARLAAGFSLSIVVAWLSWRQSALAGSGAAAAVAVGTLTYGFGGLWPALALIFFFVSSTLWGRLPVRRRRAAEAYYAKGGRRDAGQVLANGGVAAALCALGSLVGDWRLLLAAGGAIATACADTWATELGVLSQAPPRRITDLRPVPAGTSGAVSLTGLVATGAGAAATGLLMVAAAPQTLAAEVIVTAVAAGGVAGSLMDSLLGATAQGVFRCRVCGQETEKRQHCGHLAAHLRGSIWLGNDLVNLAATITGAAVVWLFFAL